MSVSFASKHRTTVGNYACCKVYVWFLSVWTIYWNIGITGYCSSHCRSLERTYFRVLLLTNSIVRACVCVCMWCVCVCACMHVCDFGIIFFLQVECRYVIVDAFGSFCKSGWCSACQYEYKSGWCSACHCEYKSGWCSACQCEYKSGWCSACQCEYMSGWCSACQYEYKSGWCSACQCEYKSGWCSACQYEYKSWYLVPTVTFHLIFI